MDDTTTALHEAIAQAGETQSGLAEAIGAKQQEVWNWLNRPGAKVPPHFCAAIFAKYGIECRRLRPDLEWVMVDGTPAVLATKPIRAEA